MNLFSVQKKARWIIITKNLSISLFYACAKHNNKYDLNLKIHIAVFSLFFRSGQNQHLCPLNFIGMHIVLQCLQCFLMFCLVSSIHIWTLLTFCRGWFHNKWLLCTAMFIWNRCWACLWREMGTFQSGVMQCKSTATPTPSL